MEHYLKYKDGRVAFSSFLRGRLEFCLGKVLLNIFCIFPNPNAVRPYWFDQKFINELFSVNVRIFIIVNICFE